MNVKQRLLRVGTVLSLTTIISVITMPLASAVTPLTPAVNGPFNFNVSPPSIAVETVPGAPITVDIRLQNAGIATENINTTLMKFTPKGDTGVPDLRDISPSDDFGKWATISPSTFIAEPNEWKTVHLVISPPTTAAFGYYYAVQFSREGATKQVQKGKTNLLGAVASLVLLDVKAPGAVRKVNVAEFSTNSHVSEFLPVNFNVRLHNIGNTHAGVRGNISISKNGKEVAEVEVNSSKGYILPQSFRNFKTSWADGTPVYKTQKDAVGNTINDNGGNPVQSLSWDKFSASKLRFGKYNARLVMIYNDGRGDVSTEARLSFWVIPWRIIAGVTFVGLFVAAGIWALIVRPLRRRLVKPKNYEDRSH